MRTTASYSLTQKDSEKARSVLQRDGKPLGLQLDGLSLDAQFDLPGGGALLWLTETSPYDEGLHVYLLDPDDKIEDSIQAGADFSSGILKIQASGDNWVEFTFFTNDLVYRLEVAEVPVRRVRLATGWRYKKSFAKHRLFVSQVR